ncbi:MAG: hypothetical protein ACLFUP_02210 [Desulfobacteraceae bacterium]
MKRIGMLLLTLMLAGMLGMTVACEAPENGGGGQPGGAPGGGGGGQPGMHFQQ